MNRRAHVSLLGVLCMGCLVSVRGESHPVPGGAEQPASRLEQLIEANIVATHAYQVLLAKQSGRSDLICFSPNGLSEPELQSLVDHQAALLHDDLIQVLAWTRREPTRFDPARDLEPMLNAPLRLDPKLPVNVFSSYLIETTGADRVNARAIATLYQVCLEVDRDGTLLWDLMDFIQALGLPTYTGQLGLPGTDEDFLAVGRKLAQITCDAPFPDSPSTPFAWEICGRKIWNWGLKNLHVRDQFVMARELLEEPDIRILIPSMKALEPRRIAVIGHSFTMQSHWATPGSFAAVVGAVLAMTNPAIQYRQWGAGGLTASRAYRNFYSEVLDWKPDLVLFAVALRGEEDRTDFASMCNGLAGSGARVCTFDNLQDPSEATGPEPLWEKAGELGLRVIEVEPLLNAAPDRASFLCLDKIHMTEPYHRLVAREWLRFLLGARSARLSGTGH